ncbi:MAG: carbohydrate kinase family protein [Isosphaeraceae bacterium]
MASAPPCPVVSAGVLVADHLCTPIDHMPVAGELVRADELVLSIGGLAANVSVNLARLGVRAAICGKVGDDVFGRYVAETLESQGVDTRCLGVDPQRATSQTLIVNVKGEDRRFIHSFGANAGLSPEDLDRAISLDPPPRVLYLGGYLILPGLDPDSLAKRLVEARRRGILTVLDVACPGPSDYLRRLEPILQHTDVFLPNDDEAALILGETDPVAQADAFHGMGAKRVIITCGEHGAVSVSDGLRVKLGTYPIEFVDGTGGGDAFDSGYIAGLIDGLDELACLRLASAVGASCVRATGATLGVFQRAEADAFIAAHDLLIERC